jgi:hypothetical protein
LHFFCKSLDEAHRQSWSDGSAIEFYFQRLEMTPFKFNRFSAIALVLSATAFVLSCGRGIPSKLDHLPDGLGNQKVEATGIYPDAWVAKNGSLTLQQPVGQQVLSVRGMVPQVGDAGFRSDLELMVNDKAVGHWNIGVGDFSFAAPVPPGGGTRRITIAFDKLQELPGGDGRVVGARLNFIGFESAPSKESTASDVVRGLNLQLGSGWGVLETFHNENFRWVANDAQFLISVNEAGNAEVSLVLESGPGLGGQPFVLHILDASGRQVSAEPVAKGRNTIRFIVPVEADKPNGFRLHVDGGGKATPNDPRILNFRVFEMESAQWKAPK